MPDSAQDLGSLSLHAVAPITAHDEPAAAHDLLLCIPCGPAHPEFRRHPKAAGGRGAAIPPVMQAAQLSCVHDCGRGVAN